MSTEAERQEYANHLIDVYGLPLTTSDYVVNEYWQARVRVKKESRTEIEKSLLSKLRASGVPEGSVYLAHSLLSAGFLGEEVKSLRQLQAEARNKSLLNDLDSKPSMYGDRKPEKNSS